MGKATKCIKMLQLLNTGKIWKISELASKLEISERSVMEYKRELELCGYRISSTAGRNGGYRLENEVNIPSIRLTKEEEEALQKAYDVCSQANDFLYKESLSTAFGKIVNVLESKYDNQMRDIQTSSSWSFINKMTPSMPEEEVRKRYISFKNAIKGEKKVRIKFLANDNTIKESIVRPYTLFVHQGSWFTIAFVEPAQNFYYLKLSRINEWEVLKDSFKREDLPFNEADYINKFGLLKTKDGGFKYVKFKFTGGAARFVKDWIYGKDQVVDGSNPEYTILSCKMQYPKSIYKFALKYGEECEVLEPQEIRDEVKKAAVAISKKY